MDTLDMAQAMAGLTVEDGEEAKKSALDILLYALYYQANYERKVKQAAAYIKEAIGSRPQPIFGVTLGTRLGQICPSLETGIKIKFSDIPHFPVPGIDGHKGMLIIGDIAGVPVIGLQGRKHYYEVADLPFNMGMLQVVFPVNVLAELGVKNYFATNAARGLNLAYQPGDLMVYKSHIHAQPDPLIGRKHNFRRVDNGKDTDRFPQMSQAYDLELQELLLCGAYGYSHLGGTHGRPVLSNVHCGTLIAVTGPTTETEGENISFRDGLKADAVGTSVTAEVIAGRSRGMKCMGFSCIAKRVQPDGSDPTSYEEATAVLESPEVKTRLCSTITNFFELYKARYLK